MKKRILSVLLVAVMLATMIVVPAYAQDTAAQTEAGYCQHCETVIPEDKWIPWDATNTAPKTDHYYLAEDIADQSSQITINLDDDLLRHKVCLDLRGRSYTVTGRRPFLIYGIFSIMDSVGGGEIAVTGASNAHGGFAQMSKEDGCKDGAGELNIYSGTIRRISNDTDLVSYGGLVWMTSGSTLNLYGGKLIGGEVVAHTINSKLYAPRGGTIYCNASTINIKGGTVTGGVAIDDHSDSDRYAQGGNIYATGSTVNISGGTVENGACDTRGGSGGNIYATGSNVNISGGTVQGGYCGGAAGNINVSGTGKLTVSGGVIRDGVCTTTGGNLRVNSTNMAVEFTGGEIYGDIYVNSFKSLKLSGTPKIYMGNGNGLRLYKANNAAKVDVAGLTEGAVIYLDGVDQVFTDVLENPVTYLSYFKDAIRADITVENGALKVAQGSTGFCPHCWESGEQATWVAFDNSTPNASVTVSATSTTHPTDANNQLHTYFTADISRTRLINVGASTDTSPELIVDMAGKTLTVTNYKFSNLYGTLSLLDSYGNGKITGTGQAGANGGLIMGGTKGNFNMYSGTLSRTVKSGEEGKRIFDGGVLYAPGGAVNIYGGIIRDGIASIAYKNAPINTCGGNIYASGTFNMTGGAIIGGTAVSCYGYVSSTTDEPTKDTTFYCGYGGNVYVSGTASIHGGHVIGGSAGNGGNIYATAASTLTVTGGVIRDGSCNDETAKTVSSANSYNSGGNIFYAGGTEHKISGGIVRGGQCYYYGGNIRLTAATVTVENGSVIAEGIAGYASGDNGRGGNFHVNSSSTLELSDSTIGNGYAYNAGGNLFGPGSVKVNMHSGLICGGTAAETGGNMYCNGFNMSGGIVTGGTSGSQGGNIYVYQSASNYLSIVDDGDTATPAPVISNGTAGGLGGNIYLGTSCTGTLTGAVIENGNGDTGNKTTNFNGDNIYVQESASMTMTDTVVSGIVSDSNYGNGVYSGGALTLKGNTNIINEEQDSCVYIGLNGSLTVDAGFTGQASVAFEDIHFMDPEEPQGDTLDDRDTAGGVFAGKLFLEGYLDRDYGLPAIIAVEDDTKLHVTSTAVVDTATGEIAWFTDAPSAIANMTDGTYLRLHATNNTLELTDDLVVDLNGKNLAVTGTGTVYGFDSANDDYDGYGIATVSGVTVEPAFLAPNGRQYVTVTDENGTSFHRLGITIGSVSLRASNSGIYYQGAWACDSTLQGKLKSFGVAVSTVDMPDESFASDSDTLYTAFAASELTNGVAKTSVLIKNIIKADADNQYRGTTKIYAAPYAIIDDGTETGLAIVSEDRKPEQGGVVYTMQQVLQSVDRIWPKLSEAQQASVKTLYDIDSTELALWELYNITAAVNGTASIRPLKILTLGHSLAVDSGHMLNLVADVEGYSEELVIGTLYYSGCPLYKHVNFLRDDSPVYQLYLSSTATPDKAPTITKGMTMKGGIKYDDWDIIIMQGGVFEIAEDITYTDGKIQIIQDYVNQHKTNPNAIFAWHMPWAPPTDTTLRNQYPYSPNSYYTSYVKYNDDRTTCYNAITGAVSRNIVTDSSFIYLIPSGTAIENALSSYLEETDLHRDYVHVSDLGRVISSYTWYCTLAGIDHLDEIKLDAIPKAFLNSTANKTVDRVLTDAEKTIILEAVNNALANPLQMTQSQYTEAPTE